MNPENEGVYTNIHDRNLRGESTMYREDYLKLAERARLFGAP
jgi:hypothetical protein